jgi:hypothetical protein
MKKNVVLLLVLSATAATSCKKDAPQNPLNAPPQEPKWIVSTVAGNGLALFADGPATTAGFRAPLDIAVTPEGIVFVADALNHRIRKIQDGQVSTFAGIGIQDTTSGNGNIAGFALPSFLVLDKNGNLLLLDVLDPRVRKLSPGAFVSVVAGNGVNGFVDGPAQAAEFGSECLGITSDDQGNAYVVDWRNRRIRKITAEGLVTTIAGNGKAGFINGNGDSAEFLNPSGIAMDNQGNLFVGDQTCIRKITPEGTVSTFCGSSSAPGYKDGEADVALFSSINDLVIDNQGNIYASDADRIRKITPAGVTSTFAGSVAGYNDGDATSARFNGPVGLAIDKQGSIYVADDHNNRVRKISFE